MRHNPYHRFREKVLTINDYLAIDRTILANERTLLAYARTSLALLAVGGSCIKFFDSVFLEVVGVVFIAKAIVIMIFGWRNCQRTQRYLSVVLQEKTGTPEHPLKKAVEQEDSQAPEGEPEPESPPRG